jgi:hypothetical protein
MTLSHYVIGLLLAISLGVSGCAGPIRSTETYPTPMPLDLPVGIDEGLLSPGWDGGFPLRLLAFIVHPIGIGLDLLISQPLYLLASKAPETFGYTVQDEIYQQSVLKYRYHWRVPER